MALIGKKRRLSSVSRGRYVKIIPMNEIDFIEDYQVLKASNKALEQTNCALEKQVRQFAEQLQNLTRTLDWYKRQMFGRKSEKQINLDSSQAELFTNNRPEPTEPPQSTEIKAHHRVAKKKHEQDSNDTGLRFDDSVPRVVIEVPVPELEGPDAEDYTVVGYNEVNRLAQQPGSNYILVYRTPVVKRKSDQSFLPSTLPANVLEGCVADVSFLAGMMVDKAVYHLPLYRQHQRLLQNRIRLARSTLTNLMTRAISLIEPIYHAQWNSVLSSDVLAMDEVPIKAGRSAQKQGMQQTYFWPIYGDQNEVVFTWSKSRGSQHAIEQLRSFKGTLLSDGHGAYVTAIETLNKHENKITHASCWAHARRYFERALAMEPQLAQEALNQIAKLYQLEKQWREQELSADSVLENRQKQSEPIVREFFDWAFKIRNDASLLPSNPLSKALHYVMERHDALKVFLANPFVQLDTNHLERALRVIPMGRKNFMFCWSELGAVQLGMLQSLMVTCRLHDINPYTYLLDVLQRVGSHPASRVDELIPRNWKRLFSDQPMGAVYP
jgi:transposase